MTTKDSTTLPSVFVYFICAGSYPIKIGVSDNPLRRLADLQTAHYKKLSLLYTLECTNRHQAFELEEAFHRWYGEKQILNEWFDITPEQILQDVLLLRTMSSNVVSFRQHIAPEALAALKEKVAARVAATVVRSTNARDKVRTYIANNPSAANMTVRQLAEIIGVGKDSVAKARKELGFAAGE